MLIYVSNIHYKVLNNNFKVLREFHFIFIIEEKGTSKLK